VVEANRNKVIAIVGPTCTGKSECAIWLARQTEGEIINADSMQVYRHFNIGSAKPDVTAQTEVPHHLIDIVDPEEEFNAELFKEAADRAIRDILSRMKRPAVVGGTGLYLRILFHGLFAVPQDKPMRKALRLRYQQDPLHVFKELKRIDAVYASKISPNDRIRVLRALEVYYSSGVTMSQWHEHHGFKEQRYRVCEVGLKRERTELYERINQRVDRMLESGWVEEVEGLLKSGYSRNLKPFLSIGYRDILRYLDDTLSYAEMTTKIKQETRHYAKRQMTWFSKEKNITWFEYPEEKEKILEKVRQFLQWN
jgi:tRNA dimethylallyltransferase